jgi:hypothetical protein
MIKLAKVALRFAHGEMLVIHTARQTARVALFQSKIAWIALPRDW